MSLISKLGLTGQFLPQDKDKRIKDKKIEGKKTSKSEKSGESKSKTSFLQALNTAEIDFTKEALQESLGEIEDLSRELMRKPTLENLEAYKEKVQKFLKQALNKLYKVENKNALAKLGQEQKVFVTVETIDIELEKLTLKFIKANEDSISIINDVEGINGLLYNVIA